MFESSRAANENGFLLGEALIALSILVVGLMTVSEAIGTAQRVRMRAEYGSLLAACAQDRLIQIISESTVQTTGCESVIWTEEHLPVSPQLVRTIGKASLGREKRIREELFETITTTPH